MQISHVEIKALIENNSASAITRHCRVFLAAKWALGSEQLLKTSSLQSVSEYRPHLHKGQPLSLKNGRFDVAFLHPGGRFGDEGGLPEYLTCSRLARTLRPLDFSCCFSLPHH